MEFLGGFELSDMSRGNLEDGDRADKIYACVRNSSQQRYVSMLEMIWILRVEGAKHRCE